MPGVHPSIQARSPDSGGWPVSCAATRTPLISCSLDKQIMFTRVSWRVRVERSTPTVYQSKCVVDAIGG
ncbi:hypothetical protein TGPRC2_252090 [Toxoplasma gondii TgCatPRC2]|uniref:Uncharacterized protein n=14 Tax=Toxoplasma gondii TaxID=5811 RepID=A0A125YI73_TOXGV|nr:hypothetical protein TGME49_252090 [Toxoplasma gondii ME49]EPR59231.1 hypothetical protein TGGT1_252090 [Toxoplasma gondii GT1]ESS30164.1 hypothetical protein TGVEG_252090 [Toxoplasma gondii VEG]KFG29978.1 hypothetical protein TGDOM2_252090 [Toxoplasma gondii GAB2-2007-GAL-DOM2]KFG37225.1 hypothetical protein TGFOU_252090 [Toxoplasma gondii FOU]KFG47453.1 hypothetical protein TGP89_252090 [Toxoplasma gondii p89]KFG57976.1 hypothetical protein TGRUB_252090 [Toxoplasma gondii RUB]KFH03123.1|eukprot:XP_018638222.1 hypothetical protein TGME49_252090 [Toxoplasma gondii ME49]